jgi:hypothetical protein
MNADDGRECGSDEALELELHPPAELPGHEAPPPDPRPTANDRSCPSYGSCCFKYSPACPWPSVADKRTVPDTWKCDLLLAREAEMEESDAEDVGVPRKFWRLLGIGLNGRKEGLVVTAELIMVEKHDSGILVLAGPTGVGKSVEAAWWAYFCDGRFMRATDLARADWYDERVVAAVVGTPALVIDDVGAEYNDSKGYWRARLDEVLSTRYDDALPTVVTTNLPREAFRALVGERVWDRIGGGGKFYQCVRPSLRGGAGGRHSDGAPDGVHVGTGTGDVEKMPGSR